MTPSEIAALIQAIMLVATFIVAWRKLKPEVAKTSAEEKKTRADALETATDATSKSADMFYKAMDEIAELRAQQKALEEEMKSVRKALKQSNAERNAAFNWAARLIKQMKEMKPEIEPVEYLPPTDTESSIQAIKMGKTKDGS